jgi:predicted phosphodiesterase
MKLALLSDLHANLQALDACLAHAQAQGAERIALLGDLVGYGAQPAEVIEKVRALQAQGAVVLQGNHDEAALSPPAADASAHQGNATARWTHAQLDETQRAFLAGLPLLHQESGWLLVHASAHQPTRWPYVDDERSAGACLAAAQHAHPTVTHVFCGHVHHQRVFYRGVGRGLMRFEPHPGVPVALPRHRGWVLTVGSTGQPRDGDPRAMYALFDASACSVTFHRVSYDLPAACQALRRSTLPTELAEALARRLENGR